MNRSSTGVQLMATQYAQQADAAEHAKYSMPEPIFFDPVAEENNIRNALGSASSMSDVGRAVGMMDAAEAKQRASHERHMEAVRVMNAMDQNYHQTAQTQPSFAPPRPPGDGGTDAASAAGPSIGGLADSFSGTGTRPPGPGPVSGGAFGPPPASPGFAPGSGVPGAGPGPTGGFGVVPAAGATGGAGDRSRPPRGTGTPGGNRAGARVTGGATPPRAPRSAANSGSALGKPGAGGKPGGTGSGAGTKSGPVTGGGKGPGTGVGLPGGKGAGDPLGQGKSTGASPGRAAEIPRGGAAAASAAKAGAPGMPFAPGTGRGRSGDDEDRKAPDYLRDPDPDETFGTTNPRDAEGNKPTAPVIGDVDK